MCIGLSACAQKRRIDLRTSSSNEGSAMSRFTTTVLLCLPPLAIIAIIVWCVGFIAAFRRSFGAHAEIPVGAVAGAAILLVLHAGYFAAPWLVHAGRAGLALMLMVPAALLASGLALFLFGFDSPSADTSSSDLWGIVPVRTAGLAGTALVYLVPLVLVASTSPDRS